ncbi:MAG: signal peptidase I [Lachnospiraceae bacterium]|nr:signal peptidase I [Lachnospiraceae bacterium]
MQKDEKENKEESKKSLKSKVISGLCELLLYVVIALVCIFIIPKYVVQKTEVSGPSMESTLHNEDYILLEKLSYRFTDPDRFDIIVFYHFDDEDNQDKSDEDAYDLYVKRIIGLPGETVQIIGETIYINGEPLEENYGKDPITDPGIAKELIVLGEDEYFVLGDNREVSKDSRSKDVGKVKRDLIVGRAWVRLYPLDKIGFLTE